LGTNKIKADFGGERITDRNSATAFMLTLSAIYRNKPHWKLADKLCDKLPNRQPRNLVLAPRSRPPLKPKVGWKIDLASIAARTFGEMRFGGPISAGGGWSRAARARLAGFGGVMFSMIDTIGPRPTIRNAPKRHVFASAIAWPPASGI